MFEEGTFVPVARITEKQQLSIVTNYLGTPEAMYREDGEAVWTCELNSYGKVRNFQGEFKTDCPFRYQGQYEDSETGLFYNRFRYYDADTGVYICQDPIGLEGGVKLYGYVHDPNTWIDEFGLAKTCPPKNGKKPRSPHPIGKRKYFSSKKQAYEAAKRAGKGEPVLHYKGNKPHYHPGDGNGNPLNHDHYNFPKGK